MYKIEKIINITCILLVTIIITSSCSSKTYLPCNVYSSVEFEDKTEVDFKN